MFPDYHRAIVDAQYERLKIRAAADQWTGMSIDRDQALIYVTLQAGLPEPYKYVSRIDMARYPVDPYWVGFINPDLPRLRWSTTTDCDPRFWPWSPMPGLHGSFVLTFLGPFRTFWCRECTFPFFHYHGDRLWAPSAWPLDKVVAYLREAVEHAVSPDRWRPMQRPVLLLAAANAGIGLPEDAGLGAK